MRKFILSTVMATSLLFGGITYAAPSNQYIATDADTFWTISQKFNVQLSDLIASNPNVNPQNIYAGVVINLPVKTPLKQSWEVKADAIIATGMQQLGTPYVFGGSTPYVAFDCSGFVQYAFNQHGFNLLHSSALQSQLGTPVDKSNLRKGDLVFLQGTYTSGVSHVGIYLGDNKILQAGTMGTREVKISTLFGTPYYDAHYWGARRLIN
ncbi:cell wall-associated NlpC family hydrolase [Paenibacillus sp. V4I3]|uniref:C40 family peptidase n=1 Tax=unclassified Paenibacillus TaxID=185978 RepID=UPI00278638E2|nr:MULTISPECIES: LysM peptidoglycan-binding domain-containing C40 family peptidase [unclassified Paenibacillus]MDQ0876326.1 cell wall-associated NlpC family hydrolase [Paenibacillus sp. V4I3]MDQ0887642.1 cell wall-associated NlpC family hydrolase [Paenibacillus sp. V4I9]